MVGADRPGGMPHPPLARMQRPRTTPSFYAYRNACHDQCVRWLRRAGAVLLCALLFFLWMEESRRLEDPLSMIKIERNVWRRMVLAKHIFGYDLENYCERRFLRFNLSPQVWRANPIQCNPIFSQRLSGLDFSVENRREKLGRFCYSRTPTPPGGLDGRVNSIDNCNSATIRNAEGNTLCRNANLWRRY